MLRFARRFLLAVKERQDANPYVTTIMRESNNDEPAPFGENLLIIPERLPAISGCSTSLALPRNGGS